MQGWSSRSGCSRTRSRVRRSDQDHRAVVAMFTAIAKYVLFKTKMQLVFAVGGDRTARGRWRSGDQGSRSGCLCSSAFWPGFSGMHLLFSSHRAVRQGAGNEFFYIIAAVIGGCLLTGGYGTAIGAASVRSSSAWQPGHRLLPVGDPDWFKFFLGAVLLFAVIANNASVTTQRRVIE